MELLNSFRNWLKDMIESFIMWVVKFFQAIFQWFEDILLTTLEKILEGIRFVISSIPMPDFLQYSLQDLFNYIPSDVVYFLNMSGIAQAFLFISMGVAFRLVRKVATLFQW
ncbi:DUF2523 family protein [Aeromonas veronii]|uniref:DUF2523 family protein n=1 Tax=Aeromonas TaxID=642 RepID=UPI00210E6E8C|nr:DUF2523 family protein [Aeromonas sp. SG16]MCQ4052812.1 DUF2523 domain-containing protein [Aeromonas sp. SG16]HDO1319788.1 DUF2523 domain-containing protein [Aeromonas veronii]